MTRRRLGGELKRLREGLGLKLEDVARSLECSQSKISRLENGKGVPRWRDVRDMLNVYRVPEGDERERLLEWARTGQAKMWWQSYADIIPTGTLTYVELEWDASQIDAFDSHIVHGLLQTRDYARSVLKTSLGDAYGERDFERLTEVRMRRQEALTADHGLYFRCVLDESTLYRVVGSPEIQRAQIEHLIHIAEAEHVEVRIIPFAAGLVPNSAESFAHLRFEAGMGEGIVYVERPGNASEYLSDPDSVRVHREWMAVLVASSLTESDSIPLMKAALDRLRVS
ncbi:helix-turn-helix domain-containing protein [Actinomycetospora sp. C-140]